MEDPSPTIRYPKNRSRVATITGTQDAKPGPNQVDKPTREPERDVAVAGEAVMQWASVIFSAATPATERNRSTAGVRNILPSCHIWMSRLGVHPWIRQCINTPSRDREPRGRQELVAAVTLNHEETAISRLG